MHPRAWIASTSLLFFKHTHVVFLSAQAVHYTDFQSRGVLRIPSPHHTVTSRTESLLAWARKMAQMSH